jgi:hypothetical protein
MPTIKTYIKGAPFYIASAYRNVENGFVPLFRLLYLLDAPFFMRLICQTQKQMMQQSLKTM